MHVIGQSLSLGKTLEVIYHYPVITFRAMVLDPLNAGEAVLLAPVVQHLVVHVDRVLHKFLAMLFLSDAVANRMRSDILTMQQRGIFWEPLKLQMDFKYDSFK